MNFVSLFAQSYYYPQDASTVDSSTYAATFVFVMLFMLVCVIITYVITSFLLSRIFRKAGIQEWKAWVPVYNNWILLELGGQKGFWAVLAFVPIVNIVSAVFMLIAMYHVGLRFGKDGAFVLLAIFIPLLWYVWLAFDSSTWKGASQLDTQSETPAKNDPGTPTDPAE